MFKTVRYSKISQGIVEQIRTAILDGRLKAGDRLPPERQLMEQFGVSKATLREAVRALETLGFIEVRKGAGGGPFVVEVDTRTAQNGLRNFLHFKNVSIEDLTEVRSILEPYITEKATNRISKEELKVLQDNVSGTERELSALGTFSYHHEIEFHRTLAAVIGNPILLLMINFIEDLLRDHKEILKPGQDFSVRVRESHKKIYEEISTGDTVAAAQEMSQHVKDVGNDLIAIRCERESGQQSTTGHRG
jgi:GntR family transcriptional repressor for pyruvate dehydrogenase complex